MNKRIDELIEECTSVNDDLVYDGRDSYMKTTEYFDKEKFAELIVQECAQVSEDDITDGDACCTNTADRIARQIKKHFGVEE